MCVILINGTLCGVEVVICSSHRAPADAPESSRSTDVVLGAQRALGGNFSSYGKFTVTLFVSLAWHCELCALFPKASGNSRWQK